MLRRDSDAEIGLEDTNISVAHQVKDSMEEEWGDEMGMEMHNVFWVGMLNIGGFPVDRHSAKAEELWMYIANCRLDAIGLTECNAHWKMIPIQYSMAEQTRGWWESMQINTAYYSAYKSLVKHQAGGVSLWSINKGAHRVMDNDRDFRGLGRWAWTRYRGRNNVSLRVVTVYRPVLNRTGVLLVWNQHKSYFELIKEDRCPREIFVNDLVGEVAKWLEQGNQLVV